MKNLKKPKRPLTAYHIYFQIESEFIIQTMAGEDADKSIHEGKTLFHDVPKRYRDTRLSPDWYFAPGKRAKRKHRKQHGTIGFFELTRVISSRWNKLDETDPEIKQFVSRLADQEMNEYKRELKEYRENLAQDMITPVVVTNRSSGMKKQEAPQTQEEEEQPVMKMGTFSNEFHYASTYQQRSFVWGERRPQDDFVDICDDDILSFWKSTNA